MSNDRTAARARKRRWSHRFSWLSGVFLVCLGALAGAFGTIAWLTALCATSLPRMMLGMVSLGLVPVLGGGAMLWAGLGILEGYASRARVRDLPEGSLVEAARAGGSAEVIAARLGVADVGELTCRLDDLVAKEVLSLDIEDDGELSYRPTSAG